MNDGAFHPVDRCAWCGNRSRDELRETVHKDTHRVALICTDHVSCMRRQYHEKVERRAA